MSRLDLAAALACPPPAALLPSVPRFDGFAVRTDTLDPAAWDALTGGFADVSRYQTAAYADGLRGGSRMSHLLLLRGGQPVAGARLAIIRPPGLPSGVAYLKEGPFWRREGVPADPAVYRAVIAALADEYGTRRGHCLTVCPRPHPLGQEIEVRILRESGFAPARHAPGNASFLVRLDPDAAAMRASLSQKWRYNLKLAERNGLAVSFRDPMEALPEFHALNDAMVARKRFTDRAPLQILPRLFRQLPPGRCLLASIARDGETLAAAVVINGGDTAHYLFGASADEALALRAGYALHWRIARRLAEEGVEWYDLGNGVTNPGLRLFKQGFVGRDGVVQEPAGEFDHAATLQARLSGQLVYGLRAGRNRVVALQDRLRQRGLAALIRRGPRPNPEGQAA